VWRRELISKGIMGSAWAVGCWLSQYVCRGIGMVDIRRASGGDIEAMWSFNQVAQRDERRREFIAEAVRAGQACVAVVGSAVAGFVILEYTFFQCGFVSLLYVHPDFRRQGVGAALMRHIERICKTPKLFTSTNQSNHHMQALLEKLGYVRSGMIENLDVGDPELVYFKQLSRSI